MILNAKELIDLTKQIDETCVDFAEWINNQKIGYHSEKREWYFYEKSKWINTKDLLEVYKNEKNKHLINK